MRRAGVILLEVARRARQVWLRLILDGARGLVVVDEAADTRLHWNITRSWLNLALSKHLVLLVVTTCDLASIFSIYAAEYRTVFILQVELAIKRWLTPLSGGPTSMILLARLVSIFILD